MIVMPSPRRRIGILVVLFMGTFVMGTAEMLIVGMVEVIAADLDVSVAAAGALLTANALGLAVGGPVLTLTTARCDRRPVLVFTLAVFVALNLVPIMGSPHVVFLGARVAIGAAQGLFIAAAISTATAIAEAHRAGRAMAAVITGSALASALGLPVGTLLGFEIGWRGSFGVVVAAAALVLIGGWILLPSVPPAPGVPTRALVRHAFAPRVLTVLGFCVIIFTAIQAVLTYLVPILSTTGVHGAAVGAYLAGYGVATTVGSAVGGRLADAGAALTLVGGSIGVTASIAVLGCLGGHPVVSWLAVAGIGFFGMGMAPSMQHRTVHFAGVGGALAASLPSSAVNVGIAAGSTAGGVAIVSGGASAAVTLGVGCGVFAIAWACATLRLRARQDVPMDAASAAERG